MLGLCWVALSYPLGVLVELILAYCKNLTRPQCTQFVGSNSGCPGGRGSLLPRLPTLTHTINLDSLTAQTLGDAAQPVGSSGEVFFSSYFSCFCRSSLSSSSSSWFNRGMSSLDCECGRWVCVTTRLFLKRIQAGKRHFIQLAKMMPFWPCYYDSRTTIR